MKLVMLFLLAISLALMCAGIIFIPHPPSMLDFLPVAIGVFEAVAIIGIITDPELL